MWIQIRPVGRWGRVFSKNAVTKLVHWKSRKLLSYLLPLQVTRSLFLEKGHSSWKEFVYGLFLSGERFLAVPPKEASHNCKTETKQHLAVLKKEPVI